MRDSFILYTSYKKHLTFLSLEQKGLLLDYIFEYAETDTDTEPQITDSLVAIAFSFIREDMARNNKKYKLTVEKNKENGKKGGAPKGNQNALKTTENNPTQPKTSKNKLSDNDNDNDSDNDK